MQHKYYMPIKSTSLAHYFASACIAPSDLNENRIEDIQNNYPHHLLLNSKKGKLNSDCCLEVILTDDEKNNLTKLKNNYYLLNSFLPISRISKIIFETKEQSEVTRLNIEMSTAFVPARLIFVDKLPKYKDLETNKENHELQSQLLKYFDKYNKILGAFALLKHAVKESQMNYSENYFSTLSFFNSKIEEELKNTNIEIKTSLQDFFDFKGAYEKFSEYFNKNINFDDLVQIANIENQKITENKITGIINTDALKKFTKVFAVIYSYGVGNEIKKLNFDDLILTNFTNEFSPNKIENFALCFGYYKGYTMFSKSYKYESVVRDIKFKLNSKLDYFTIESIYQFVFNNVRSTDFPYLNSILPQNYSTKLPDNLYEFESYKIIDEIVVGVKIPKINDLDNYIKYLLQRYRIEGIDSIDKILRKIISDISKQEHSLNEKIFEKNLLESENEKLQLEKELDKKENDISNLKENNRKQHDEISEFNKKYTNLEDEVITLKKLLDESKAENEILREEISQLNDKITEFQNSNSNYKEKLMNTEIKVKELIDEKNKLNEELSKKLTELSHFDNKNANNESEILSLKLEIDILTSENLALKEQTNMPVEKKAKRKNTANSKVKKEAGTKTNSKKSSRTSKTPESDNPQGTLL